MIDRPLPQKTIGILGGASNIATAEYYRLLNTMGNERLGNWDIPEILIASMNFGNIEAFVRHNDWDALEAYLADKVDRLIAGGADMILCVSNTLHKPLANVMATRDIAFIHIADPAGQAIAAGGLKRVALFGTKPTMALPYLPDYYRDQHGIDVVVPRADEQDTIDQIIFDELVRNIVTPASTERYLAIAERMMKEDGAQGVIMGCTEIFLLLTPETAPDIPQFNTTVLHCEAAIKAALPTDES